MAFLQGDADKPGIICIETLKGGAWGLDKEGAEATGRRGFSCSLNDRGPGPARPGAR
jgi:hypothetical protein